MINEIIKEINEEVLCSELRRFGNIKNREINKIMKMVLKRNGRKTKKGD